MGVQILAVILGSEIVVRLVARIPMGMRHQERADLLGRLPGEGGGDVRADTAQSFVYRAYGTQMRLHPFFGFTFKRGDREVNNQGFFSGVGDFPYRKGARELVIGLFGGSVGMQSCGGSRSLVGPLEPDLASRGYDRVTLVCFAIGGWRQPQSFIALSYYLSMIDVAIVLDGFNDVIHTNDAKLASFPGAFPWSDVYGQLALSAGSPEEVLRVATLIHLNRTTAALTKAMQWPVLRHSMVAHLAWRLYVRRYQSRVQALRGAGENAIAAEWSDFEPPAPNGDVREKRDRYFDLYADSIRFSGILAAAKGKLFFHFVQPNQYLRGSKPLSQIEKEKYVSASPWFDIVTPSYGRLDDISAQLRREGIESTFLGRVFADVHETVYNDDCCHLNDLGVKLMNEAMADRILRSGHLAALSPPS